MRLPNGMGSVYKMSGRYRKPWRAVKTTGWQLDSKGEKVKQNRVTIGYYHTKEEALQALMAYNENPYDIKKDSITFAEVYEKWSKHYFETLSNPSSIRTIQAAYRHCTPLYYMRFKDIRVSHLEGAIYNAVVGTATKARMKSLFNMLYRYAMKHEIVTIDYAHLCDGVKQAAPEREKVPFTEEEIETLWKNVNTVPFADMILIGIYSGWRPQELAILKTADIDLEAKTMRGGMKTAAGKNRIVPIHPYIMPLIKKRYNPDNEYLFNDDNCSQGSGRALTYDKYRGRFKKAMESLKMDHRPHETRHTFITLAKEYEMDEYILKHIVGHNISDITEKVYTHRKVEQLYTEICKIQKDKNNKQSILLTV
ncbi:MAG: tyrosine-type recombinase/integrase [Candidatus Ornithomonoglobus sp.]